MSLHYEPQVHHGVLASIDHHQEAPKPPKASNELDYDLQSKSEKVIQETIDVIDGDNAKTKDRSRDNDMILSPSAASLHSDMIQTPNEQEGGKRQMKIKTNHKVTKKRPLLPHSAAMRRAKEVKNLLRQARERRRTAEDNKEIS